MKITDNERKVFEFIKERIQEGYAPTIREVCERFGFRSTSTAHRYVRTLTEKGLLEKGDHQNRALKLAGSGSLLIPLVGLVTAGQPITAIENISEYISFNPPKSYDGELFALKIRGESMINAGILDGDIVIVEQTPVVDNGEMAVVLVDGTDSTVKTFYKEDGHYRLQPENDTMDPIIVDEVSVLGRVAGLIRYY